MTKSPTACLNEVLLRAALRAERANAERLLDGDAQQLAKRNDNYAREYRHHRVHEASQDAQAGN
jgi:hypothetical protein